MKPKQAIQSVQGLFLARDRAGGTWAALAAAVSRVPGAAPVTRQGAWWWSRAGVPADRAVQIEEATGIPRSVLRPDLFPEAGRARSR